jgi:hypothetical protein
MDIARQQYPHGRSSFNTVSSPSAHPLPLPPTSQPPPYTSNQQPRLAAAQYANGSHVVSSPPQRTSSLNLNRRPSNLAVQAPTQVSPLTTQRGDMLSPVSSVSNPTFSPLALTKSNSSSGSGSGHSPSSTSSHSRLPPGAAPPSSFNRYQDLGSRARPTSQEPDMDVGGRGIAPPATSRQDEKRRDMDANHYPRSSTASQQQDGFRVDGGQPSEVQSCLGGGDSSSGEPQNLYCPCASVCRLNQLVFHLQMSSHPGFLNSHHRRRLIRDTTPAIGHHSHTATARCQDLTARLSAMDLQAPLSSRPAGKAMGRTTAYTSWLSPEVFPLLLSPGAVSNATARTAPLMEQMSLRTIEHLPAERRRPVLAALPHPRFTTPIK